MLSISQSVKLTPALAEKLQRAIDAWTDPTQPSTASNVIRRALDLGLSHLLATSRKERARSAAAQRWSAEQQRSTGPVPSKQPATAPAPRQPAKPQRKTPPRR